ncbi:MAG: hypothetical protein IJM35_03060, partial [Bacteroidales bacterium]|nr:hypothetical protein [Bacteroidales bacterium]
EWWITGQGAGVKPYAPAHAAGGARRSDSDGGRVRGRRPRAEDQPPGRGRILTDVNGVWGRWKRWITGQGAGVEPYAPAHAAGGARRSDSDGGRVRGRRPRAEDQPRWTPPGHSRGTEDQPPGRELAGG